MVGDVASAFRHVPINEDSVHKFAFAIPELDILVLKLSFPFGWTGSPGFYDVFARAIKFVQTNAVDTDDNDDIGIYHAYVWVDDHVGAEPDIGARCANSFANLKLSIVSILGPRSINVKKYADFATIARVLGLIYDTCRKSVSMPKEKITKALGVDNTCLAKTYVTKNDLQMAVVSLRFVASCFRPGFAFIQRLHSQCVRLSLGPGRKLSSASIQDLSFWKLILSKDTLTQGIPMKSFCGQNTPHVIINMDASDSGLCASDQVQKEYVKIVFNDHEARAIENFKRLGGSHGFDINVRELPACLYAAIAWAPQWAAMSTDSKPVHVRFMIDNTSAVSWATKLASRNALAQHIVRFLAAFEISYNIIFSARHIPGVENDFDDAGSRSSSSPRAHTRFANLCRGFLQVHPTTKLLPACDCSSVRRANSQSQLALLELILQQ